MASAGMLHRGRNTGPEGGDEVQRSLELLDSVLSEFEEGERAGNGAVGSAGDVDEGEGALIGAAGAGGAGVTTAAAATPDDDSPSLGGHQSEDDGYMSMNGRRTKFALSFRPTEEKGEPVTLSEPIAPNNASPLNITEVSVTSLSVEGNEEPLSPPPPSEAERIISTLLPKVSPSNSSKRSITNLDQIKSPILGPSEPLIIHCNGRSSNSTQTTLPKTRHQRPFGWEKGSPTKINPTPANQLSAPPQCRFSSLPYGSHQPPPFASPPSWLPPRHKRDDRGAKINASLASKRSPSVEYPKTAFPLSNNFNYENDFVLGNMPYNEHPVTIYPGANVPYTKQLNSPTYNLPKTSPLSASFVAKTSPVSSEAKKASRRDNRSDGEMLSPGGKVPPRTLAGSMERHREVCRGPADLPNLIRLSVERPTSDAVDDDEHFSDDSLEESLPPPPPLTLTPSKRSSIAWEVSLDIDDPLLTPGSTKVIGRRRRKSGDNSNSSTSSIPQRVEEWVAEGQGDYWPPPPLHCSTEDEVVSPFSDTESEQLPLPEDISEINATGTYIIRRGKKDRKHIPEFGKKPHKPPRNIQQHIQNECNRNFDGEQSVEGSSLSISGMSMSGSHNSVSSLNSRLSSDLSIPHSRYSVDFNTRFSRELTTPNSRYSVDLCIPSSNHLGKELTSPKSRLSLDLNNGSDKHITRDFFHDSPKSKKLQENRNDGCFINKNASVPNKLSPQNRFVDFKKYSCTFDNIQSLMKEGIETSNGGNHFNETSVDLGIVPPSVVRVVSLPSLTAEAEAAANRQILTTTVEEEEDFETPSHSSEDTSPLKKIENNISALLSQGRDAQFAAQYMQKDWDIHKDEYSNDESEIPLISNMAFNSSERHKRNDIQKSSSHNEIPSKRLLDYHREKSNSNKRNGIHKSTSSKEMPVSFNRQTSSDSTGSSGGDFPIHVQIVEHSFKPLMHDFGPLPNSPASPQFPPLPPSPVQEDDDEYSEIIHPLEKTHISKSKADTMPTPNTDIYHRSLDPPIVPPHREPATNSLKTRSMDTGFSKNRRNNNSNKNMSTDRRTLPSDMGIMSGRRRTFQRQRGREDTCTGVGLQTSASLPETPVFGRGCDVPRTPHRRTTEGPRQSNTMTSIQTISGSCTVGGYGRGAVAGGSMERAIAGAELLRLAGGPARGWYPKQRHRPASIEHLERLPMSASSTSQHAGPWDSSRKPLTLPPNLTPKFFQKSPREALRRVTSLLIRKGNSSKETAKKERQAVSPAARSANGEESTQKQRKGFFKNFWKRSRHYSLEHP